MDFEPYQAILMKKKKKSYKGCATKTRTWGERERAKARGSAWNFYILHAYISYILIEIP